MKNKKLYYYSLGAVGALLVVAFAVFALKGSGSNLTGYLTLKNSVPAAPVPATNSLRPVTPSSNIAPSTSLKPQDPITSAPDLKYLQDKVAPTVTIDTPYDGQTIGGKSVTVIAYANDDIKVTKVEFRSGLIFDLQSTQTKPNPETNSYKYVFDTSKSQAGMYMISVWAYDAAGNVGKKTISIKLDNAGPDFSVDIPDIQSLSAACIAKYDECANISGNGILGKELGKTNINETLLSFNLKTNVTDINDISKITFSIDNIEIDSAKWGKTVDVAPYSFSQEVSRNSSNNINYIVPKGVHTMYINAWDKVGNKTVKTVKFTVSEFTLVTKAPGLLGEVDLIPYIKNIQITN